MESAIMTQISSFLSFGLGKEIFAVNVSKVFEILEINLITKVRNSLDYMRGVTNLRGRVLPVVSTRASFGLPEIEDTVDTCIIVLDIELNGELLKIGTLVDSVKEVLDINQEEMEPAPSLGKKFRSDFILGMWKQEEEFIMVLDIDKVFSADELIGVEELKETV